MKQIAITGGKGGVGKSTVAVLLANHYRQKGKKVVLTDADVECPNDYLLLGEKLTKKVGEVFARLPVLDKKKCQKCGVCVKNCRAKAIFQAPGKFPVFIPELCSGCGLCWHLCPYQAIGVKKQKIGEIYENKIASNFYLLTGRSVGVVEETGPIVTALKEKALNFAKKVKAGYLLTDTAVGAHCGVIRALLGSNLALAVTEPTPLGAHDLKVILNLLKTIKVPGKIVLNQADLGKKSLITKISEKENVPVFKEIPYSSRLAKLYSKGKLRKVDLW